MLQLSISQNEQAANGLNVKRAGKTMYETEDTQAEHHDGNSTTQQNGARHKAAGPQRPSAGTHSMPAGQAGRDVMSLL